MLELLPRALLGIALFVLASAFAILTAPLFLPILAILAARREKPNEREHRLQPLLGSQSG